jgi:hypothetical protein
LGERVRVRGGFVLVYKISIFSFIFDRFIVGKIEQRLKKPGPEI